MFEWLQNLFSTSSIYPLPDDWQEILRVNAPFRSRLDAVRQERLDRAISVFVEEKYWEGCNGFEIEDEHRLTIAAHALRLVSGFEKDLFDDVQSILVYPTPYIAPTKEHIGGGVIVEGQSARLGESWYQGPVILAWSDIEEQLQQRGRPQNVIIHEFAHVLDFRNGSDADGVPPIESNEQANRWLDVTRRGLKRHHHNCRHRRRTVLDCYGASNQAEFFAVSTEAFFEAPEQLQRDWPDLFDILREYYRQDPLEMETN